MTEFIEKSKKAKESEGGFLLCTTQAASVPGTAETAKKASLVNLEQVEWVFEVE